MNGEPCTLTHYAAERDLLFLRKLVLRQLPTLELPINVFVQRQLSLLDQIERAGSGHGFADRSGLKKSPGRDERRPSGFSHSIDSGRGDFEVINNGDTQAGYIVNPHQLLDS